MTQRAASLWHAGVGVKRRLGRADYASGGGGGGGGTFTFTPLPTQPFANLWDDSLPGAAFTVADWGHPGSLVSVGRVNYAHQKFKDIAAAGACVILYIDMMITNTDGTPNYGRYHGLLGSANSYGAAVPKWPGNIVANSWGSLADFRVGSAMHAVTTQAPYAALGYTKLEAVLETAVAENPHLGGFFADDLGSRSYFGGSSGSRDVWNLDVAPSVSGTGQSAYRAGAILAAQTFRRVCDRHGLALWVNGTWDGGTLAANGGGYPTMSSVGLSLADGGFWEHHTYSSGQESYILGSQWADAGLDPGTNMGIVAGSSDADRITWKNLGTIPYVSGGPSEHGGSAPWGSFHASGLPHHVS